jgi:hypothetical protein
LEKALFILNAAGPKKTDQKERKNEMRPKNFKESNIVMGKGQEEYEPLPAFRADDEAGMVVSCWQLSWRERLRALWKGEVWLMMMTFRKPMQPVYLTVVKPLYTVEKES